jgi:phage baseplate assembly protein W
MLVLDPDNIYRGVFLVADVRHHLEHLLLVDSVLQNLHSLSKKPALWVNAMNGSAINPLGQGLSFPPRVGPNGQLAWSAGEDNIRELLQVILMTQAGERLMRENFGCGLRQYLFAPNTVATRQSIQDSIERAVALWEPRVSIDDVAVSPDPNDPRRVNINVQFRIVATQGASSINFALQLQG